MPGMLLEVIVQTVEDARAAARGGADRLEVVRAIAVGGLTPPLSLVRAIASETTIPLRVMVRERAGYETTSEELPKLHAAVKGLEAIGVDGIVIGFARHGVAALDDLRRVLAAVPQVSVTFHRAFDSLHDPLPAIDALLTVPQIDRLLTSGGEGTAARRGDRLREYVERARGRLTIIAGGGVDEDGLVHFARTGCVTEVHVGRAAREGGDPEAAVSVERVRRLKALIAGEDA